MYSFSHQPDAIACISGGEGTPGLTGTAKFYQKPTGVLAVVHVSGLPQNNPSGFFALHIHEGSSCSGEDFSDTGMHYNPEKVPHPRHAGDLPVLLSCDGEAFLAVLTDRFCVEDIIGRTLVIHSGPDDYHSQPAGNAGTKMACGVIQHA